MYSILLHKVCFLLFKLHFIKPKVPRVQVLKNIGIYLILVFDTGLALASEQLQCA